MKNLLFIVFSAFLFSCQERVPEQVNETINIAEEEVSNSQENAYVSIASDTVQISGKSVVFFSITQEEYDRIVKEEGEDSGINEVLDDFSYYASEVANSLNKAGYKTTLTTKKTFAVKKSNGLIKYVTIDSKKGEVGVLLFDGMKEPMIDYGVGTDIDYLSMVEEYFGKK